MYKYEIDPTRTEGATWGGHGMWDGQMDGRTDGRTEWNQYTTPTPHPTHTHTHTHPTPHILSVSGTMGM